MPEPKETALKAAQSEGDTPPGSRPSERAAGPQAENRGHGSEPLISLPKGGGAIHGMGEKFAVNPVTGTGSLTLPLPFSPGRAGFGPQPSLSYDSGSGNGPFGFGWSLSLPTVTRKTDKGLPRYFDHDESDVYILASSEDLVSILDSAGNRITLSRIVHGIAYEIRLYRPRVEGLLARIERWTDIATGISHWRTITRDNVTTLFGFNENSRIADPADARRVFSWLIYASFDDKGNASLYQYAAEDSAGIDTSAVHEANRTAPGRSSQRYLKHILYGNFQPYFPDWLAAGPETPLPTDWHFHAVFDYGDHRLNAPMPAPDQPWPVRPDPFSVCRASFEVRSYRRCKRVLLFHNFPDEAGVGADCLVRSANFLYSDEVSPVDPRNPIYTFLTSVAQTGYRRNNGGYDQRSMPPLEFAYSQPEFHEETLTLTDGQSLENAPEGIDGGRFRMIDLDAEGLSGILTEQQGGWGYKRNLSPVNTVTLANGERVARAQFGALERIASLPVTNSLQSGQQLMDLNGNGRLDLVNLKGPVPGFYERTANEDWDNLQTFISLPRLNWSEPNLQFVDLTGDGLADVLITRDDVFTFYPSLGVEGFGEEERISVPWDEERGPHVVFADGTQTVSLADMSGDGLRDLVRCRNGEVCYWPNLGYGRFGAKIAMDRAPYFADAERFDPKRLRLADVDGSGTTDMLYVGEDGVQVWFNRSGNSWSESQTLAVFPGADNLSSVQVMDLLGNGTACLVWSSPLPGQAFAPLRYVDLMGSKKPHLLVQVRNNLGAETRLSYAPSTRFYLEDKQAGRPWITRLPFPVHVAERVETYDWIGRSRFVSRYAYHHGYFDGEEREFRGFGMVEQRDTEEFHSDTLFPEVDPANEDAASYNPPVVTRTWFHTGAFIESRAVSLQYAHEYWTEPAMRGDSPAALAAREVLLLPDSFLEAGLTAQEMREACRALKGSALRVEVYAEDETLRAENPYTVTENNFRVDRLQPFGPNQHAIFMTHARESITFHYERQPEDPRITHELTLATDDFGNVLRSVSVGYGRRAGYPEPEPDLSPAFRAMLAHDQTRLHIGGVENGFTLPVNQPWDAALFDVYRAPLPCETTSAELTGFAPAGPIFRFDEIKGQFDTLWTGANDIDYEEIPASDIDGSGAAPGFGRRIVARSQILYRSDNLTALLPRGTAESHALPGQSYRLALTQALVTRIFGARVTDGVLTEGGYVKLAGHDDWWIPSDQVFYSPNDADTPAQELAEARAHFYQVRRKVDPFGAINRISYDTYNLLPRNSTDAVGNVTLADSDYRMLHPFRVTDPNGNFSEVAFDCLGLVVGTAVSGKAGEGDSLGGFAADLSQQQIDDFRNAAGPNVNAPTLIGQASIRIIYDVDRFRKTRAQHPDDPGQWEPAFAATLARETHVHDSFTAALPLKIQIHFTYSDGLGREVQHKAQAEPGLVPNVGDNVSPRWVGSGWIIYNNKGKPVRKYEPFFTQSHLFEFNRQAGVSSVLFYDPVERVVATLHPNSTFEKTVFDAWRQESWDSNDTVSIGDPRNDADFGDFFLRLLGTAAGAFTSWHDRRIGGEFGATAIEQAANQDAAQKAASHAGTPTVAHLDSLGRTCLSVANNGMEAGLRQRHATRTALDTENKTLAVFDALERQVMEYYLRDLLPGGELQLVTGYDMTGKLIYHRGMDGGERRTLGNVAGNPLRGWDARGFVFRTVYDLSQRTTHRFILRPDFGEILAERLLYGEKHPDADRNLRGKLFCHFDGAGLAGNDRYDFKGNLLESRRQLVRLSAPAQPAPFYNTTADWSVVTAVNEAPALDVAAIAAVTAPLLEGAVNFFTASNRFDALNRTIQTVMPHTAGGRPSVIQRAYNEANLLDSVDVWIRQPAPPAGLFDSATADLHAVTNIDYDAHGKRILIEHGNGAATNYFYEPETFRLATLTTTRPNADPEQRTIQALSYFYDPVGNITRLRDDADIHNVIYFRNQRVEPSADYTYDAVYRLIKATGREHLGQNGGTPNSPTAPDASNSFHTHLDHPGNGDAMGTYDERYLYDAVGNILDMRHRGTVPNQPGWKRCYQYALDSNRLLSTGDPADPHNPDSPCAIHYAATALLAEKYEYDIHGSMTRMPHLPRMTWDENDVLQSTTRQVVATGMRETTYYLYDTEGQRVRKATARQAADGIAPKRKSERIYLGAFEICREYAADGTTVTLERETLHGMDDKARVVLVETRTAGNDAAAAQLVRYQFCNHLGSAVLELDDQADVISYEEYFPYGSSSYQAVRDQTETPKRYRYTGKERDEENELYYHGARYYAPWLGKWTSVDPALIHENDRSRAQSPAEALPEQLRKPSAPSSDPGSQRESKQEEPFRHNPFIFVNNRYTIAYDPDGRDAILISFPEFRPEIPYLGRPVALGHAGVLLIDNRTGQTRYYEYGRYDQAQRGLVRTRPVPNVVVRNGRPTEESLQRALAGVSQVGGHGGPIVGAYIQSERFQEMNRYAQSRLAENSNPSRESYSIVTCNCATFARDVVNVDPAVARPTIVINTSPVNIVDEYIEEGHRRVDYSPSRVRQHVPGTQNRGPSKPRGTPEIHRPRVHPRTPRAIPLDHRLPHRPRL